MATVQYFHIYVFALFDGEVCKKHRLRL